MRNCWYWRPKRGVNGTLCNGMYRFNENSVKILGIHFSYNKEIENDENFIKLIKKIENVIKIWRIRNLTVQSKIAVFKTVFSNFKNYPTCFSH